jgi:aquaporin Z
MAIRTEGGGVAALPAKQDQPLGGRPHPHDRLHPHLYAAEFAGTAFLVAVGLSFVILLSAPASPLPALLPDAGARRAVTGFLFGSTGAAVAYSWLGRISGAHINPAVTLAFWLDGKIAWRDALAYVVAQCAGGVLGAAVLLAWGALGRSVALGATVPSPALGAWPAALGEAGCTFALVVLLFVMAAHRRTQPFTPLVNPPLFCVLAWLEAPLSGTGANPARSLGPAVVADVWHGFWAYVVGPCAGAAVAVALLRLEGRHRPREARQSHFSRGA